MTEMVARLRAQCSPVARWREFGVFQSFNVALTLVVAIPFFVVPLRLVIVYSCATQSYVTGSISFRWFTQRLKLAE